ncbi:MAG: hypothetical protein RIF41_14220 [Polyangiaceae bacterium]
MNGGAYATAGLVVMAAGILLGLVSHRCLRETISQWYVREGLREAEARKLASRDVERADARLRRS